MTSIPQDSLSAARPAADKPAASSPSASDSPAEDFVQLLETPPEPPQEPESPPAAEAKQDTDPPDQAPADGDAGPTDEASSHETETPPVAQPTPTDVEAATVETVVTETAETKLQSESALAATPTSEEGKAKESEVDESKSSPKRTRGGKKSQAADRVQRESAATQRASSASQESPNSEQIEDVEEIAMKKERASEAPKPQAASDPAPKTLEIASAKIEPAATKPEAPAPSVIAPSPAANPTNETSPHSPNFLSAISESKADDPALQVDRDQFLHRVSRAIDAAGRRDGEVRLRLRPPELGTLQVEIKIQDGAMTARLEAETETARTLLLENLSSLRDRLAEQDIRIEQFHVEVSVRRDGSPENANEGQSHHRQANRDLGDEASGREGGEEEPPRLISLEGKLDVIV